jgi:hypothetical protein
MTARGWWPPPPPQHQAVGGVIAPAMTHTLSPETLKELSGTGLLKNWLT